MDAQLIQAGLPASVEKARARAKKAREAMTEEQKEERRKKQAEAAKAKRAAAKETGEPKPAPPPEKKEKEKLRKQAARAKPTAGAGADEGDGLVALMVNGTQMWEDPASGTLYTSPVPPRARLAPPPENFLRTTLNGLPYLIDPKTKFIYTNYGPSPRDHVGVVGLLEFADVPMMVPVEINGRDYLVDLNTRFVRLPPSLTASTYRFYDVRIGTTTYTLDLEEGDLYKKRTAKLGGDVTVSEPIAKWGQGPFTLANVPEDDRADVEEVVEAAKPDWEEAERTRAESQAEVKRQTREREKELARQEEPAEMMKADREFTRQRREAAAPAVRKMAEASIRSLEGSYLKRPEAFITPEGAGRAAVEQFRKEGVWYDYAKGLMRDEFGAPIRGTEKFLDVRPDIRPGIDVSLQLARMFGEAPPASETKNLTSLTRTTLDALRAVSGKKTVSAAEKEGFLAYANSLTEDLWGSRTIDEHIRAFFSRKSK